MILSFIHVNYFLHSEPSRSMQSHEVYEALLLFSFPIFSRRNFCLSEMQYWYEIESRTYRNMYRNMYHLYISKYSCSPLKNAFSSDAVLWEILHVCTAQSTFSSNFAARTRTDSFSGVFLRRFMYLANVCRARNARCWKWSRSLRQSNHVGLPIIRNRKGRWWGLVTREAP